MVEVAEPALTLDAVPVLGGIDLTIGQNRIVERADLRLVSVAIPRTGETALAAALQANWGVEMPGPRVSTVGAECRALRTAPDQLMLILRHVGHAHVGHDDPVAAVHKALGPDACITDQTSAWVQIEICGPDTLRALERLCALDLAGHAFPIDGAATTAMEHMRTIIVRLADDRFVMLCASSVAGSFLHAIEVSYRHVGPCNVSRAQSPR